MKESKADQKVRIGIIGVGIVGKMHLDVYKKMKDVEVVAIADIDTEELDSVSNKYNIPHKYSDFRKLLQHDEINAVDVCVHNNLHMPITVASLEAGKHVYCEKPMAGSYKDAKDMALAARRCDRLLFIQLFTLFQNETKAAKLLIDQGSLGKIYYARSNGYRRRLRPYVDGYGKAEFVKKRISGGGAVLDMGVYHTCTILHLMGNPGVIRVSGKIYQETEIDPIRKESSGYNVEELGVGLIRLEDNITLDMIEAWAIHMNPFEGSYIVGSEGGIRLEPFGFFKCSGDLNLDCVADLDALDWRLHNVRGFGDEYDSSQHHWVAALKGKVELMPTVDLALNAMLIAEGIYLSDKLGREVEVEEIKKTSVSKAVAV
jgi:predicted dehydrogenase